MVVPEEIMTSERKTKAVEEKIDQLAGSEEDALQQAKETIARAENLVERAKETLGEGYGKLRARSTEAYATAKEYLAEAKAALDAARERIGELYGRSREIAEELYAKAKERFDKVAAEAKKGYAKVKARVEQIDVQEVRDDVVEYVRKNPGRSVLIALGVGFIVGLLVRRRES
jgi:ElaB/YqjD/DUF883 family membrane-anchored ribosome-binding protein